MPLRRPRVGNRRKTAKVAGCTLVAAALGSCWVSIAPPAEDLPFGLAGTGSLDTGGAAVVLGGGGSMSTTGGADGVGGANSAGGSEPANSVDCKADEKVCGGRCVKLVDPLTGCADPDCAPCNLHGDASCNNMGACVVESCASGWANCDGSARNGCEHQFGDSVLDTSPGSPLLVSEIALPPMASDWAIVPLAPVAKACAGCIASMPGGKNEPAIVNVGEAPPWNDISAYFRLGHNANALYLEALVFDNELIAGSSALPLPPLEQDSILVLFDGKHDGGGYGADDHYLQLGLNGAVNEQERASDPAGVTLGIESLGPACYRMQATFTWAFISGLVGTPNVRPPPGTTLGFDVMANDVDRNPENNMPERQSLLFWQLPGTTFAYNTDGFPAITLQ
ncbi:MAG: sugar-binding protein [Polyangiaceae bacterium]|nr:sugar-binding protein [Polyangiaceae bacterium]